MLALSVLKIEHNPPDKLTSHLEVPNALFPRILCGRSKIEVRAPFMSPVAPLMSFCALNVAPIFKVVVRH